MDTVSHYARKLISLYSSSDAQPKEAENGETRGWESALYGLAGKMCAPTKYVFQSVSKGATAARILDTEAGKWLVRLDRPHGQIGYHVNLNRRLTKLADPHVLIPGALVEAAGTAAKVIENAGKVVMVCAVAHSVYRIGEAVIRDVSNKAEIPRESIKAVSAIAGAWAGGSCGAHAGAGIGSAVGATAGFLCGGIGTVPGSAVGSIAGSVAGGFAGGVAGGFAGAAAGDAIVENVISATQDLGTNIKVAKGMWRTATEVVFLWVNMKLSN